jgi:type 1 fimbria pilin
MKMNYWKMATIILGGVLLWLFYWGHTTAAQYSSKEQTYNVTRMAAASGHVKVSGEVVAFSCVADVRGSIDQGNGLIESGSECYVLSK